MALATALDVATRLGRSLTDAEQAFVNQGIATLTDQIATAADKSVEDLDAIDPVPATLTGLIVEKVVRVGSNPEGLVSETKQVGAMSRSRSFDQGEAASLFLTDVEEQLAVEAVYGKTASSSSVESFFDRIIDLKENRDVDEEIPA